MIRDAAETDLPALCLLLQQLAIDAAASTPPSVARAREEPDQPSDAQRRAFASLRALPGLNLLVVEEAGRVVGTAMLLVVESIAGGARPRATIDDVVVDSAFRGRGLGALLIRRCMDLARARGVRKLQLASNVRRTAAHRFYERLGFVPSHRGYSMLFPE